MLTKFLPYLIAESTPLSMGEKLRATLGAFFATLVVGLVSSQFLQGSGLHIMVTSMGASAVLLFAAPHSPLTQPWPLIGGHLISAFIGVACAMLVPDLWAATALAVSLSILAMHLTHSLHPPGGAIALMAVLGRDHGIASDFSFVLAPVGLNALLMLVMALVINNLFGRRYPARAYPARDTKHRHDDPRPLDRIGIDKNDLHQALRDMDVYLDVSEADLKQVYRRAGMHAYQRKMGEITCGDIMSRDVISVDFGTELEEAWAQLRLHKIGAIPVVDKARRVIGIISLVDFLKRANLKTYETFEDKLVKFIRRTPGVTSEKPEVVGQIMATPAVTAPEDMHIVELVPLLSDHGLHHIPIVNAEQRLVGMVTQSDLIAALYAGGSRPEGAMPVIPSIT
ncbi:MAG: HPP family protein [Thiobacillus sp.]|nr:HPP family protein [Thiobacillus sp.]